MIAFGHAYTNTWLITNNSCERSKFYSARKRSQIILVSLVNFILQGKDIEDIGSQESKLKVKWTTFLQTYTWPRRCVRVSTHPPRDHGLHKDVKRLNAHKFLFSGFSLWWEKHVGCIKFNQCKTQLPTN